MYFLLDTNILLGFITSVNEENQLEQFGNLISQGYVQLLLPETLKKEWVKKKIEFRQKIQNKFNEVKNISITGNPLYSYQESELSIFDERTEKVEVLLQKAIGIKLTKAVKEVTTSKRINDEPPFSAGSKTAFNDGLIYFTAAGYIKNNNINEFCFITRDGDFTNGDKRDLKLHASLGIQGVTIYFGTSLEGMIRKFFHEGKFQFKGNDDKLRDARHIIRVLPQKSMNQLDYLYEVFRYCQQRMDMLPPELFCRIHPIRTSNKDYNYTYYSNYTLFTNNAEFFDLFKKADIDKTCFKFESEYKDVKSNKRLKYILEVLNKQFVFQIEMLGTNERVRVQPQKIKICSCRQCLYSSMQWNLIGKKISPNDNELKSAFVDFQLGNIRQAFIGYYKCYEESVRQGNLVVTYKLKIYLKWIAQLLYSDDTELLRIKREVEEWDIGKDYFNFASRSDLEKEIATIYRFGNPTEEYAKKIYEYREKVREHYFSQLKNHYSNNSHYFNLASEYSVYLQFIRQNFMPLQRFSEFTDTCRQFTEGVFLNHALNEYQPSRSDKVEDFAVFSIIVFGDSRQMTQLFNTYVQKGIKVNKDSNYSKRLIHSFLSLKMLDYAGAEKTGLFYKRADYFRIFWNIILLLAIADFDKKFIKSSFNMILQLIPQLPEQEKNNLHFVGKLIWSRGLDIGVKSVKAFYDMCINDDSMHDENVLEGMAHCAEKSKKFRFIRKTEELDKFCEVALKKCEKCGRFHHDILYHGYSLLSPDFSQQVKQKVESSLQRSADFNLYYKSSIKGIINYDLFFDQYLCLFKFTKPDDEHLFLHMDGELFYRNLNNMINLAFKNNRTLPASFISSLKGMSDYYDWILDMEHFEYGKFKPLWILQYPTKYYLQKAFSIKDVRTRTQAYLRKNYQPTLANYAVAYI